MSQIKVFLEEFHIESYLSLRDVELSLKPFDNFGRSQC